MTEQNHTQQQHHLSTRLVHADRVVVPAGTRAAAHIAPPLATSTTFAYSPLEVDKDTVFYARENTDTRARLECTIGDVAYGGHAVVYPSGMAATLSAFIHFHPRRILAQCGYHSTFEVAKILGKIGSGKDGESSIELITLAEKDKLGKGDVIWVESPFNPTGEVSNLRYYADLAHAAGAVLIVDSTFGPPPLQNPFEQGADLVMHSATKYFGGHSDLLAGVLIAPPGNPELAVKLRTERTHTGCILGNMETWLMLRSLRTLTLRVERQSQTAKQLIEWLDDAAKATRLSNQEHDGVPAGILHKILHSSTQTFDSGKDEFAGFSVEVQMPGGQSPTFSILFETPEIAKQATQEFELVRHATSLGGVETLIEWRYTVSKMNDPRLIRVSVGLEHIDDLKNDFRSAFQKLKAKLN